MASKPKKLETVIWRRVGPPDARSALIAGVPEQVACATPLEEHPGWWAFLTFGLVDGDVVLVELQLSYSERAASDLGEFMGRHASWADRKFDACGTLTTPPPGGLGAKIIRGVKWGDLTRRARAELGADSYPLDAALPAWRNKASKVVGKRTAAEVERECAEIAAEYVSLLGQKRIIPKIAIARGGVKPKTIANRIERARQLGLLTRTTQGNAGGTLTDKARTILATEREG